MKIGEKCCLPFGPFASVAKKKILYIIDCDILNEENESSGKRKPEEKGKNQIFEWKM